MFPLITLYLGRTATTGTPSITLNSPSNTGTVNSTTPTLTFTGVTSTGDQNIPYEVQIDTVNTFNSQGGTGITRDTANEPSTNPTTSTGNFTTTQTSGSFTPQANAGIFVVIALPSVGASQPTATVTDSLSNSYTQLAQNSGPGTSLIGIYWRYYSSSPGSITVSAQSTGTDNSGMFEILNYLGVSPTQTGNTVTVNRSSAGTLQGTLTVNTNNIAVGGATNFSDATVLTALANSTVAGHYENSGTGDSYSSFTSTTTGTNVYGYSSSKVGGFAAVEVQAAPATPLIDAFSSAGTGFADITNGANSSPYPSGDQIGYTVQAGNALTNSTTYYWRVQQIVPVGNVNYYSGWSSINSFTVSTSGPTGQNFFYLFSDLL